MHLAENFWWQAVPSVRKNQAGFTQLAQQVPMVPAEYFDSSALAGRNPRHLQNNCGEAGNSRHPRLNQLLQPSHAFLGKMRLVHKAEDIAPVFYGPAVALWQSLRAAAALNSA